jgi:putative membrane protein
MEPYNDVKQEEMILRDHLAVDRTVLANERTLLAYMRTALAIIVVGGTIMHFSTESGSYASGILIFIIGVAVFFFGLNRYITMRRKIGKSG